jgi:hypothetical protein
MNERQRLGRAELIRDEAALWFLILYAIIFLAISATIDLWDLSTGDATTLKARYLIPLVMAFPAWRGLRGWAKRVLIERSVTVDA